MRAFLCLLILAVLAVPSLAQVQHSFPALDTDNVLTGKNQFTLGAQLGPVPFSSLTTTPSQNNGTIIYCTDCFAQNPCAGSGTGALAERINGAWACTATGSGGPVTGSGTIGRHPTWATSSSLADSLWNFEDSGSFSVCTNGSCSQPGGVFQMLFSGTASSATLRADSMTLRANSGNIALITGAGNSVALGGSAGIIPDISFAGNSVTSHIKMSLASAQATTLDLATLFVSCQTGTTCSPVPISAPSIITGRTSLTGGTATVSSIAPAFASTTTEACFGMDTSTPANTVTVTIASASSITLTGTGTDAINWMCITR